jgi:hypothetical protein
MKNSGNPAQRLYHIIIKVRTVYKSRSQSGKSQISWDVWADVFDIKGIFDTDDIDSRENQLKVISAVNQGRKLVDKVESLLLKNDDIDHQKYLRPFPNLKKLFTRPFGLGSSFREYFVLGDSDVTTLEFCIDAVSKVYREKVTDENELKSLLSEIRTLYEQIVDLEIDQNLKRILLDMLRTMEDAIHEYRIRGVERLREALERLVGIYMFNKETIETLM